MGFPGGSDNKESTCNAGDLDSIPGLGKSPRGVHGNPLPDSCLENPQGQRSLVGPSPWGHKVEHKWAAKYTQVKNMLPIWLNNQSTSFLTVALFALAKD